MVRTFAILRALSVLFLICYVLVWWPWYAGHPAGMAAVAATAAWGVTFIVVSLRRGVVGMALAAFNVVVAVVLGVAAPLVVPEVTLGAPWMWLFPAAIQACVVAAWVFGLRVFAGVVAVVAAAVMVGGTAVAPDASTSSQLAVSTTLLIALALACRLVIRRLRKLAAQADERLTVAAARHRAETVAVARVRDRRERERVLHDTVLNTLTGIGWGGGVNLAFARRQCGDAVTAVRTLLAGRRRELPLGLDERLRHVADAARARGLDVTATVGPGSGVPAHVHPAQPYVMAQPYVVARPPVPDAVQPDVVVPPDVVSAFGAATAELLANVERHAGTGRARLEVHRDRATATVTVAVHDDGPGFDPATVPADRLGLRQSVQGRMADVGARVAVRSEPGRGTSVVMTWQPPPSAPGTGHAGKAGGVDEAGGVDGVGGQDGSRGSASTAEVRRAYVGGVRRAAGVVAAALQAITLAPLIVSLPRVRSLVIAVLLWLVASAGVAVAVRVTRSRPLSRLQGAALVALGVATTVAVAGNTATTGTGDVPRNIHWTAFALVLIVAFSRPAAEWLLASAVVTATLTAVVVVRADAEPLAVSQLLGAVYGQGVLLTAAAMVGPVLRRTAERTAQAMAAEADLAAMHDTEIAVRQDRARGLHAVERDVLPLLAAIGSGLLDPRDPSVRDRCTRHAGAVRRTLAAGRSAALDGIAPALVDAEERGVHLDVQVSGDLRRAPAQVRAELATRMAGALQSVPSEGATLTVFCDDAGGSLFLTYPGDNPRPGGFYDSHDSYDSYGSYADTARNGVADPTDPTAAGVGDECAVRPSPSRSATRVGHPARPLVAVSTDRDDGRVWMEMRWDGTRTPA